jgi:purine-binding chemotaxis protein CheW
MSFPAVERTAAHPTEQAIDAAQFITFAVEGDEYGIDINAVREIKAWTPTTSLPNADAFMRGVINLRGAIVPIYDLRALFGKGATAATVKHVVMIVAVEERTLGLLVDAVSDIISLDASAIQPPPERNGSHHHEHEQYVCGLAQSGERMVMLLEPHHFLRHHAKEENTHG